MERTVTEPSSIKAGEILAAAECRNIALLENGRIRMTFADPNGIAFGVSLPRFAVGPLIAGLSAIPSESTEELGDRPTFQFQELKDIAVMAIDDGRIGLRFDFGNWGFSSAIAPHWARQLENSLRKMRAVAEKAMRRDRSKK